jgi:hypothetical protein
MISIAYIQRAEDFVASKVFPNVPVEKQSDRYFSYPKSFWLKTQAQRRAPGTESAGSGFAVDNTPNYFADVWAVHKDVDDQIRANADGPLSMDRDSTLFVTQQQLLRKEIHFSSKYLAAGIWQGDPAGDITPAVKWDTANGLPINDIDVEKRQIKSQTAFLPNTFVAADDVFFAIKNNASVLDRIKYTQRAVITEEILAALLQLKNFLVSQAVQDTSSEGQTDSYGFLTSNLALLVYANPTPSILMPSGGYTFSWKGLFGAGADGGRISSFRMEHLKSDRIEGEMAWDQKLVGPDLGVLFLNPLAVA